MNPRAIILDDYYLPNRAVPFMAAFGFHIFLMIWNPTIWKTSPYNASTPVINVRVMDHFPTVAPVKPKVVPPAPKPKHVEKRVPAKKAKKSGLSMSAKAKPMAITPHHKIVSKALAAPKPFVSKITMPKFVPRQSDGSGRRGIATRRRPAARSQMTVL